MDGISVVINTWNEEKNLPRTIASVKDLATEIVVVDMESTDKTKEVAKKLGAKIYNHKYVGYVEPARNFAVDKASGPWILILDADEEIPDKLVKQLKKIIEKSTSARTLAGRDGPTADFYRLPRKNIIFGQWIRHSRWWPDHNIRFFKKGTVVWSEIIHSVPETHGIGRDLPGQETFAIIHYHYDNISQFIERNNRYSTIQAKSKVESGYKFSWRDLIAKPTSEFLSRFFVGEAYKDGVHGLALSLLQAFVELQIYLKVWEIEKFKRIDLDIREVENEMTKSEADLDHWLVSKRFRRPTLLTKVLRRLSK